MKHNIFFGFEIPLWFSAFWISTLSSTAVFKVIVKCPKILFSTNLANLRKALCMAFSMSV